MAQEVVGAGYGARKKSADGAYKTGYGTYLGDYGSPRNPAFFGPELNEVEARLRQREQSMYGGLTSQLREELANAGLLASGALPMALTQAQIGLGQSTLGGISNLFLEELGRKRQFDIGRALMLLEGDMNRKREKEAQEQEWWKTIAQGGMAIGGGIIAGPPGAAAGAAVGGSMSPGIPGANDSFWGAPNNDAFSPAASYDSDRLERLFRTGSY